jgi:hypothetical protein
MHNSRERRSAFRCLLDRFVMWLNGTQCASLHPHKNGGYVYCTKKAGHFGRHESYAGDKLTNTPVCHDCHTPINSNDDANICIECGGRNIRVAT